MRNGVRLTYALSNGFYRVSDNSRRQIQQLERRFRPALISYFFRRGFSVPDAEDLVQDVFVKLMKVELDDIVACMEPLF